MVYQASIPQPTDQLSKSQADILGNFQFLNTIASGIFDAPVQATAPTIAAGDTGLYTLFNASTGRNEMYVIDANGNTYPITASLQAQNGWTILPSGLLIKWGLNSTTGGSQFITFPVAATIPVFNNVFNASVTTTQAVGSGNLFVLLNSVTTTGLNVTTTQRTTTSNTPGGFSYIVIGN